MLSLNLDLGGKYVDTFKNLWSCACTGNTNKTPIPVKSEKKFFLLVKTAFNQRRKTLRNGVRGLFEPEILKDDIFNKRAEQLNLQDFAALTFKMN